MSGGCAGCGDDDGHLGEHVAVAERIPVEELGRQ